MIRHLTRLALDLLDRVLYPVWEWAHTAKVRPVTEEELDALANAIAAQALKTAPSVPDRPSGKVSAPNTASSGTGEDNSVCDLCGSRARCDHQWAVLGERGWQWVEFCDECRGRVTDSVGRA